jgi:serine/threonine protein kinase
MSLNRQVALKVLSAGIGLTSKAVQRFRREAEAAAKLHHTNIVPVYATGEEGGTHFYAMELIGGPSLDRVVRHMREVKRNAERPAGSTPAEPPSGSDAGATGPYVAHAHTEANTSSGLSSSSLTSDGHYFDTVARMIAEVADALEYAHQSGVVHRDIKPSNLLLSPAGRLSVNDFGLARMLEQPGMTMTGEFVGTPAYMSPEQITAGRTPLDHRTDIYSLGATLYELLTLYPPFTGERRDQVLAQILHKEPRAPRQVNPKVPVDLETICLKAMEKDPPEHYPFWSQGRLEAVLSMQMFAEGANDVQIFAQGDGTGSPDTLSQNPALGGLRAGKLTNFQPPGPTGKWTLYFNNNAMNNLWLAVNWGKEP